MRRDDVRGTGGAADDLRLENALEIAIRPIAELTERPFEMGRSGQERGGGGGREWGDEAAMPPQSPYGIDDFDMTSSL